MCFPQTPKTGVFGPALEPKYRHDLHFGACLSRAHFLWVFSGSLINPPNRNVGHSVEIFNRSCILLLRSLPEIMWAQ